MTRSARARAGTEGVDAPPSFSPTLFRWFAFYLRGYFKRHFNAVRTSGEIPAAASGGPLIVYSNHPSWWDPIHMLLVARHHVPERRIFGPMERRALERYAFFKRLGAFGIDSETSRGAAQFVRTSRAVLADPAASLWLTAEGRFTDARRRPLQLRPGLAHLARRLDRGCIVPLGIEYTFWDERLPEALTRFGEPIWLAGRTERSVADWTARFDRSLEETLDALAADACARDARAFRTLVQGRKGTGPIYDAWRRIKALVRGEAFRPAHGAGD